jgi:hypothetical protein
VGQPEHGLVVNRLCRLASAHPYPEHATFRFQILFLASATCNEESICCRLNIFFFPKRICVLLHTTVQWRGVGSMPTAAVDIPGGNGLPSCSPPVTTVLQDAVIVLQDHFSFAGFGAMLASRYDRQEGLHNDSPFFRNVVVQHTATEWLLCTVQHRWVFCDDATKQSNGLSGWAISTRACVRPEDSTDWIIDDSWLSQHRDQHPSIPPGSTHTVRLQAIYINVNQPGAQVS